MIVHGFAGNDPYPPRTGASQRLFGLYRGIASRHLTRVLAMVPNRQPGPAEEHVGGFQLVRHKAWYTSVAWRLEQAGLAPLFLAMYGHRLSADCLRARLTGQPDVVMADIGVAGVLERASGALRVYHAHNVEADHFASAGPRLLARDGWAARLRALEARACAHADRVVVTSEEDAARMQALYGVAAERLAVVPNGFDETALRAPTAAEHWAARSALGVRDEETVALLLGSDVPHNRAALDAMVQTVMPHTHGVRLLVVGSVSRALDGRRESWLIAAPETESLLPLLHASDVGVNPVSAGSGSNVKLPTYLAAGLAVLTTPHGLRGYADLASSVQVAELPAFAEVLAAAEHGWAARGVDPPSALARYAWGTLGDGLGATLERVLGGRSNASTGRPPAGDAPAASRHAPSDGAATGGSRA